MSGDEAVTEAEGAREAQANLEPWTHHKDDCNSLYGRCDCGLTKALGRE